MIEHTKEDRAQFQSDMARIGRKLQPKHTPGPWKVTEAKEQDTQKFWKDAQAGLCRHRLSITAGTGYHKRMIAHLGELMESTEANARLIAAAPAMYEALVGFVAAYATAQSWPSAEQVSKARAAIAAAEGRDA